ncbi:hypothetical protein GCM10023188_00320 [Pontibacter saemangeumensis]|uniref:Type 1 periplasmic binding fold superfamily protein n=1 Tax=Pontibacter saemangeumensis TaxID=1084525 RepID=A0ABP8L4D8_9BACT
MKNPLKSYYSALMIGALLVAGTSCKDDEPKPEPVVEQETITTVTLNLVPEGKGQNATVTFGDQDKNGTPEIGTLTLAPNTVYNFTVDLFDDSKTPPVDISAEVLAEGDEHELFFQPSNDLNATIQKTDMDKNNRPIGLEGTLETGEASSGTLKVTLKHQEGLKGTTSDISKGETDVEVDFPTVIQ